MGLLDRFRQKPPNPPQRVLASIRKTNGQVELLLGRHVLLLDALPSHTVEWLSRLSPPLLIETDVQTVGDEKRVVGLGSVQPHPRVAALRAVNDTRHTDALEYLALLGEIVADDVELLSARLRAYVGLGRTSDAEADFAMICSHPESTASDIAKAFEALPAVSTASCSPVVVARIGALAASDSSVSCRKLLSRVQIEYWSLDTLLSGIDESLSADMVERWDLDEAQKMLGAARSLAPSDPRVIEASTRVETVTTKIAAREKKKAAALLASRPNFDNVEGLFGSKLPSHLRDAWERHYDGQTVGFGFFAADKDKLKKLTDLASKLEKDMPEDLRRAPGGLAHQVLPFAIGEHDDEYFALDLTSAEDGDYAVLVLFLGRGEGWVAYPTTAAWIAGDGLTHYG